MALVAIIREIVRGGIYLSRRYKYLNPTDKFIRKFVPPGYRKTATRFARAGEIITTGGIIYEGITGENIGFGPQRKSPRQYYQKRQTRNNMVQSRSRRRNSEYCYPRRTRYRPKYY